MLMMRRISDLVVSIVILSALVWGCIPRHPPHTPQPVPEAPNQQASPADQRGG